MDHANGKAGASSPGALLRQLRRDAGLQARELAAMVGISPQYLSDIEQQRRDVPPRIVRALPASMRKPLRSALIAALAAEIDGKKYAD